MNRDDKAGRNGRSGPAIAEVRVTPIAVTDPPLLNAAGLHAPYALRTILEIVTGDGVSGISEIPGSAEITAALEAVGERLIGLDPFRTGAIRRMIAEQFGREPDDERGDAPWDQRKVVHLFSAVEVACLDIMGKVAGLPVAELLGGRVRESVPFSAYLFFKFEGAGGKFGFGTDPSAGGWEAARQMEAVDSEGIVAQAEAMCREFGFCSIKLKGGAFEPRRETDAIFALRDAFGPDCPLRFDPNAVWKPETALEFGRRMEPVLEYLEDPVRGQKEMARLRKKLKTPLATNMCTTSFDEIPSSLKLGSEDIILSDHHYWGGLRSSVELSRICEVFGRDLSMHSNSHLGISLAAMVHLGAVLPRLPYALDTHYPWQSEEVIRGGRFEFEEGAVRVPDGPGLGVELDRKALARLHRNYVDCGLVRRDDQVEMQKVEPGWEFRKTRW